MALSVRGTQPFSLTQYATPIQFHETLSYNMGIFAQDQWRINRLTVNYGVRLDYPQAQRRRAGHRRRSVHAGAQLRRGRECAELERHRSPRGRPYDLFGDGKTAVKAQHGSIRRRSSLRDRTTRQPGAVQREPGHADVGATGGRDLQRHLQPVQRLRSVQPGRQHQASRPDPVRCDQQPGVRTGDGAHDQLRPGSRRRLARAPEQLGRRRSASSARSCRACRRTPATRGAGTAT